MEEVRQKHVQSEREKLRAKRRCKSFGEWYRSVEVTSILIHHRDIVFVPVSAERSPGKSPEQDNMDFLMQESCSNKSLLYRVLRMFMAESAFEVMEHPSMYPSLEQGRLSRQEQ